MLHGQVSALFTGRTRVGFSLVRNNFSPRISKRGSVILGTRSRILHR